MELLVVALIASATAALGALGGLGGAVLLVPVLVLLGWSPLDAAPVGMAMVAASSLAALPAQARGTLTNHRLGVVMESAASLGAAAGAVASLFVSPRSLIVVLAVSAILAALVGGTRTGQRYGPVEGATLLQQPGRLASAYLDEQHRVIPYRVRRIPAGMGLMGLAGVVAGLVGTSGGYIKTPVMSEVMHVPVKVAAATTTFMVAITASVALAVYASQGRLTTAIIPGVIGGLAGGRFGALAQGRLPAPAVRRVLSVALIVIAIIVLVEAV